MAQNEQAGSKGMPLRCVVQNGRLVLDIGVDTLAWAFVHGPVGDRLTLDDKTGIYDESRVRVTDAEVWAKEVSRALNDEGEDGSTPLTRLLDEMFQEALDQGAEGVRLHGDDPIDPRRGEG